MVSFSCETCGDVLTKKKLDPHRNRCRNAAFTCIDCMVCFSGTDYRSHTSCITEDQKYQGALYKPKKQTSTVHSEPKQAESRRMAQKAFVEDVTESYEAYRDYEIQTDDDDQKSIADLPEAPTPPPAVEDPDQVNVFDFLVGTETPNASTLDLQAMTSRRENTQIVNYDQENPAFVDPSGYMIDDDVDEEMVEYGAGAIVPAGHFQTPGTKIQRRKSKGKEGEREREDKKDKKRKRLHIETSPRASQDRVGDEDMVDAPPELQHSGLTGSLNRLMRPSHFPPSPDYSGGDGPETTIRNPTKKSKQHKSSPRSSKADSSTFSSTMKALIGGSSSSSKSSKSSKKRKHSTDRKEKHKEKRHRSKSDSKLIEYRPQTSDGKADGKADSKEPDGQLVVYRPSPELFLGMCTKGPESERGYSVNKALKRYHRQRSESGASLGKLVDEKELFRSLRMRRNDRGEIVLFSV